MDDSQCIGRSTAVTQTVPWAQQELQPARVWSITGGGGVTVAVLDSGVSATAPALSGAVLPGLDVLDRQPADTDCLGHGTFTAGIIAARPAPGDSFAGVAPQARILPVNVVDASGSATSAAVASGISYAVTHGATVVDISVNTTPGPSAALAAAVASAVARNVVVIAPVSVSATNQANEVSYPAAYPGVIAVAAVDSSGTPVASAGKGVRVDLAAPGAQVLSIGPSGPGLLTGNGAAVATAFVAGTAALVRSYYPQLSAAQVVHRLEVTADQPGTALPNAQVGYGTVDPYTAVTTVLPEESGGLPPPAQAARAPLLPPPAAPDTWPAIAALLVCTLTAAAIAAAVTAVHVVRHGRRRGWRPPPARSARHQR
jgi:type VII secretion-associated serine protease mycosin